ncbi:hypothetical protein Bbelb_141490, partial [Branchiostoma belcheri]
ELLKAAKKGDTVRVQQLLAEGVDPNAGRGYRQGSSLHKAAYHGHHGTVSALLRAGADVNAWDNKQGKRIPLHRAAERGHHETVSVLLTAGADVNAQNQWEYTALHLAAMQGHPKCAELLLKHGADTALRNEKFRTAEDIAADENTWGSFAHSTHQQERVTRGRKEILKLFREHKDEWNALHKAAYNGQHETVSALLSSGADVNTRDNKVAENGHHETVSALLTAGADVNAGDNEQSSPLHDAAWNGHHETVAVLLTAGAEVNARDDEQRTPLHLAAYNGYQETVSALLTAGADVNARDNEESTPLHDAASRGHPKCAEILLQHGADTGIRNKKGRTAEDISADGDTTGAFVNNKDEEERIVHGRKEILRLLQGQNNSQGDMKRRQSTDDTVAGHSGFTGYHEDSGMSDEEETSQVQLADGAMIVRSEVSQIQPKKGGKRKSKTRHLGKSSDSGRVRKRPKQDEEETSQVQLADGAMIVRSEASQIQPKKGGKRKSKTRHLGKSSDSGRVRKRPKQGGKRKSKTRHLGKSSDSGRVRKRPKQDEEETSQVQLADGAMIVRSEASQIQPKKGTSSFNKLPADIRQIPTLKRFKPAVKQTSDLH